MILIFCCFVFRSINCCDINPVHQLLAVGTVQVGLVDNNWLNNWLPD